MSDSSKAMPEIKLGSKVQRIAADYTNGRTGEVIELRGLSRPLPKNRGSGEERYSRARVIWTLGPDGKDMPIIRTWVEVSPKNLKLMEVAQ